MKSLSSLTITLILAAMAFNANACHMLEVEHSVYFENGATTVSAHQIKKFAEWRIGTRKKFYSGFDIYILGFEGRGITGEMAKKRISEVQRLLLNSGLPQDAMKEVEIRPWYAASITDGPDVVRLDALAHCPNYCCSLEPLPDNVVR